jgi:hypothetical protein
MRNSSGPYLSNLRGRWQDGAVSRDQALYELSSWEEDLANRTDEDLEAAWALRQEIGGRADIAPGSATSSNSQPLPNEQSDTAPISGAPSGYSTLPPQAGGQWDQPITAPTPTPLNPPIPPPVQQPQRVTQQDDPTLQMRVPTPDSPAFNVGQGSAGMWPGTVSVPPIGSPSYVDRLFDQALAAYQAGQWAGASEMLAEVVRLQPNYSRNGQSAFALLTEANNHMAGPVYFSGGYDSSNVQTTVYNTYPSPPPTPAPAPSQRSWTLWIVTMVLLLPVAGGVALWGIGVFRGSVSEDATATPSAPTKAVGRTPTILPTTAKPTVGSGILPSPTVPSLEETATAEPTDAQPPTATSEPSATAIPTATFTAVPTAPPTATPLAFGPLGVHIPASASASSYAPPSIDSRGNRTIFEPANAIDGNRETAWRVAGDGVGHYLVLQFTGPIRVSEIQMIPGYTKIDPIDRTNRFTQNRRVKRVRFEFEDGSSTEGSFVDDPSFQTIEVGAKVTRFIKIVILETYPPNPPPRVEARDFTPISEVQVVGEAQLP